MASRSQRLAIACAVVLVVACQRTEREPQPTATATAPATAQSHKPGEHVDVNGIDVQFLEAGMIAIHGHDRWGNSLDTTYENSEFLRNALPVLERAITAEQLAGLRALVGVR